MRRVFALPLIALALVVPAGWASAAVDDVKGPACADIIDTDWGYSNDGTTATVTIFLATASCANVSYTLFVQDSATETGIESSLQVRGDGIADDTSGPGTDSVTIMATVPAGGQDGAVCLFATTSSGRHLFDRAPDAGLLPRDCVELIPGGTGGGSGFG